MKLRLLTGAAALLVALATVVAPAVGKTAKHKTKATPHYYLALGDSLSVGYQPNAAGVGKETKQGYVNDLYAVYKKKIPGLQLVQVGCPGDTTASLLTGKGNAAAAKQFKCDRKGGSQLAAAEAFLKAHHNKGEVPLITIDIGANDVDGCASVTGGISAVATCVGAGEGSISKNTPKILGGLRKAAPKGATLAAMNLYDPILAYELQPYSPLEPLGQLSISLVQGINATIGKLDKASGFKTADVASAFNTYDTTPTTFQGAQIPTNVAEICTLTWMCAAAPVGPNIHANAQGYGVIAKAFEPVIGKL
jgi:lysophospholipase L1-like esterase